MQPIYSNPKTFSQKAKSTQINSDLDEICREVNIYAKKIIPKFGDKKTNITT
jgi:hypothetical protein